MIIPWDRIEHQRQFDTIDGGPLVEMGAYEVARDPNCPLDVNGDGAINLPDLAILLQFFGQTGLSTCPCAPADFNCDGSINLPDLAMLLAQFGATCEGNNFMRPGGGRSGDAGNDGDQIPGAGAPPSDDPFIQWLRSATVNEIFDWYNAGMPH